MNKEMDKKGITTLMMILEIIVIVFAAYSIFSIASKYASSETTNKIILADDIKMMVDTLIGTPGEAVAQYPGNVSKYTFILSSSIREQEAALGSVSVFIKGEGEQKKIVRSFVLPEGYLAFGTLEGKDDLCLAKEKKKVVLRECVKAATAAGPAEKTKTADDVADVSFSPDSGFYGIPLDGERIVFLIDRSGSMERPSGWKLPGIAVQSGNEKASEEKISEMEIAEWQIKSALQQLPEEKYFTLLFFSHTIEKNMIFSQSLVKADQENKAKASKFAEGWEPIGATDLYIALKKALSYDGVDTIFFVSDGVLSVGITDPEEFLSKVRELNKKEARINTIATFVIKDEDSVFAREEKEKGKYVLQELAAQNDGVLVLPGG